MITIEEKFRALEAENAPGQEARQETGDLDTLMRGEKIEGEAIDFSHGDIDAHPPTPHAEKQWMEGFEQGGAQAYTEYRGAAAIREDMAEKLSRFTRRAISAENELIITPGTQGALFLALGATVDAGTKVAVVEPDYFANRKLVQFFGGIVVPIPLYYQEDDAKRGIDLEVLAQAFKDGTKTMVFSTPNNPTGSVASQETLDEIARLAAAYGVTVIVDQLYSRLRYSGESYAHLRANSTTLENIITIMGPSKTESLSGFRLGVAFGTPVLIERMERLQAIVSLRAAGYNQAVLRGWFSEPDGWMEDRIQQHEAIRDDLLAIFRDAGMPTATPQAGSYLFPKLPEMDISVALFVKLLRHQAGVTVTPGSEFGPTTRDSVRLNFSQDHMRAVAAAKRIVEMVQRYKK